MSPPSEELDPRFRGGLTALLGAIAVFSAVDLLLDRPTSPWSFHLHLELAFVGTRGDDAAVGRLTTVAIT